MVTQNQPYQCRSVYGVNLFSNFQSGGNSQETLKMKSRPLPRLGTAAPVGSSVAQAFQPVLEQAKAPAPHYWVSPWKCPKALTVADIQGFLKC
jgi:hypothetical protein